MCSFSLQNIFSIDITVIKTRKKRREGESKRESEEQHYDGNV